MSTGLASLHKILKDETRRKIVLLLSEKGSQSYTLLMNELGISSTGMLNYHLKVLGDLLTKNEIGQYSLSEKGILASRLLLEFPEENHELRMDLMRKRIWFNIVFQSAWAIAIVVLYSVGYIDVIWVARGFSFLILYSVFSYLIYRTQRTRANPGSKEDITSMKIAYTSGGIALGLGIAYFGVLISLRIISDLSGRPLLQTTATNNWFLFFSLIVAPTIGGLIGYWLGRKRGFRRFELKLMGHRL